MPVTSLPPYFYSLAGAGCAGGVLNSQPCGALMLASGGHGLVLS